MSCRARPRMAHPRRVATNAVDIAINRARRLSDTDVHQQMTIVRNAVAAFCRGENCRHHWVSLADTANMAETLAGMRLGGGHDAQRLIETAQKALADVHQRHTERGTWTLYADEIDALQWLVGLHLVQLEACSYGEFEQAYRLTAQRMQQALAGNASPGARVIVGHLDGTPTAAGAA